MSRQVLVSVSAVAVLVALGSSGAMPASAQTTIPRTAWGQPDLQGIWDFRTITPLERPEDLAEQEFWTEEEAASLEQEAVDRKTALRIMTVNGAKYVLREDKLGSIETGKWADLIVIDRNPLDPQQVPDDQPADIQVLKTIVGGEVIYDLDRDGPRRPAAPRGSGG